MKVGIAASIKRITAPDHRAAEAAVAAFDPFADRERYIAYLCKLHAFYAAIEPPLFAWLYDDARRKLPLIEDDLQALDAAPASGQVALPRLRSLPHALGVGYVLEGKTLGSRFLLEEARRRLGLGAGSGASFFAGYGERTGPMWRAYLDRLTAHVEGNGQRHTIVNAARATFRSFTGWIAPTSRAAE